MTGRPLYSPSLVNTTDPKGQPLSVSSRDKDNDDGTAATSTSSIESIQKSRGQGGTIVKSVMPQTGQGAHSSSSFVTRIYETLDCCGSNLETYDQAVEHPFHCGDVVGLACDVPSSSPALTARNYTLVVGMLQETPAATPVASTMPEESQEIPLTDSIKHPVQVVHEKWIPPSLQPPPSDPMAPKLETTAKPSDSFEKAVPKQRAMQSLQPKVILPKRHLHIPRIRTPRLFRLFPSRHKRIKHPNSLAGEDSLGQYVDIWLDEGNMELYEISDISLAQTSDLSESATSSDNSMTTRSSSDDFSRLVSERSRHLALASDPLLTKVARSYEDHMAHKAFAREGDLDWDGRSVPSTTATSLSATSWLQDQTSTAISYILSDAASTTSWTSVQKQQHKALKKEMIKARRSSSAPVQKEYMYI